jgi:hypothetical protein
LLNVRCASSVRQELVHHRVNTGGERDGLCGGEELSRCNRVTRENLGGAMAFN